MIDYAKQVIASFKDWHRELFKYYPIDEELEQYLSSVKRPLKKDIDKLIENHIFCKNDKKAVIRVDSRENECLPIIRYFLAIKQPFKVKKLDAGDYCWDYNEENGEYPSKVIDTKKDIEELCTNLTKKHDVFKSEILRANEHNCKLIVLIRKPLKRLESVKFYKIRKFGREYPVASMRGKPVTNMNMETLYKIMYTQQQKYNLEYKFCSFEDAGKEIIKILGEK